MLKALGEETACAAAGIVDGFIDFRIDGLNHGFDDLARREELSAIVALFAHLQEQSFVHLREREDVRRVHSLGGELIHLVEHIQEITLGVDAHAFDAGHDFADNLLTGRGVRPILQALQLRQQLCVDEVEKGVLR
jgi:hypothetical protein